MGDMILSAAEEISVVDVYDLASDIGKQCEKIIDLYGADAVTSLMPKVINALELLEALANRNENENSKMQTLTDRIAYLESEKQEKAVFRERFQKVCDSPRAHQWLGKFSASSTLPCHIQAISQLMINSLLIQFAFNKFIISTVFKTANCVALTSSIYRRQ